MSYSLITLYRDNWKWDEETNVLTIYEGDIRKKKVWEYKLPRKYNSWKDALDIVIDWYIYYKPKLYDGSEEAKIRHGDADNPEWVEYCRERGFCKKGEVIQMTLF